MIDAPDLTKLSHAEKDALILALLRQLAVSEAQIEAQVPIPTQVIERQCGKLG